MRDKPDFSFERAAHAAGARRVAGVDEVGRGPLAGPVMAAAVCLDPAAVPEGLDDSKKLSRGRREALAAALYASADVSVASASVEEIAELNILRAAHLAMCRAVAGLAHAPDHVLIDGKIPPHGLNQPATMVVRGDARVLSIAAASIAAKVARDAVMAELAQACPGYGWETNAGYPTPAHRAALLRLGATEHHRRGFRPVARALLQDPSPSA